MEKWRGRRLSLVCAPELDGAGLLVWADNLFLLDDDAAEMQRRMDELQVAFLEVGLALSDYPLEWIRNARFESPVELGQVFSRVGRMPVLGVCIDDECSRCAK